MSDVVVKVDNVSKVYKLYDTPFDRVKESLNPFKKKYHKDFFALSNVSFELRRGEALGVIGRNGNGKSTLLKIIAQVLTPTNGDVKAKGKISAILELTSSLNQNMTGLENIYLNLKINGFNDTDIQEKTQEIIDFSDIGDFIRQPVKVYSTGMKSRLGFGIATSVEPDLLILDEVMAVGDFVFRQKCLSKINAMRESMSVIFVSHSMNDVRAFCDRVLVLNHGLVAYEGCPDDAVRYYLEEEVIKPKKQCSQGLDEQSFYGEQFYNKNKIKIINGSWDGTTKSMKIHEAVKFSFRFQLLFNPRRLVVGVPIWNVNTGELVTSLLSDFAGENFTCDKAGVYEGFVDFDCCLNPGMYLASLNIRDGGEFLYRQKYIKFSVVDERRVFGAFTHKSNWWLNVV